MHMAKGRFEASPAAFRRPLEFISTDRKMEGFPCHEILHSRALPVRLSMSIRMTAVLARMSSG